METSRPRVQYIEDSGGEAKPPHQADIAKKSAIQWPMIGPTVAHLAFRAFRTSSFFCLLSFFDSFRSALLSFFCFLASLLWTLAFSSFSSVIFLFRSKSDSVGSEKSTCICSSSSEPSSASVCPADGRALEGVSVPAGESAGVAALFRANMVAFNWARARSFASFSARSRSYLSFPACSN